MSEKPQTVEDYLDRLGSAEAVGNAAALLLDGQWRDEISEAERPAFSHGLLRWAVSESPGASVHWSAIAGATGNEKLQDRDRYVVRLWRALTTHEHHQSFRDEYFERWRARESYERHLFHWFLARLDLPSALALFSGRLLPRSFHLGVLLVVAGAVVARFSLFGHSLTGTWILGVALILVALVAGTLLAWPGYAYVQSLVPRLGAAVGIGYLFLLASPELMAALHGWSQPAALQLAAGVLVVAVVWSYGVLEVSRRVEPPPPWGKAYLRTLPVMAMGLAHTSAGLGLLVPLLEALRREAAGAAVTAPLAFHDLVLFAVVALALGVVLELAWGERPITEPLG